MLTLMHLLGAAVEILKCTYGTGHITRRYLDSRRVDAVPRDHIGKRGASVASIMQANVSSGIMLLKK